MTTFQDVIEELNAAVKTAFELPPTSPNYRDVRAASLDWRGLIAQWQNGSGGLQPPYVITQVGRLEPAAGWSALDDSRYAMPVTVTWIGPVGVAIEAVDDKMQALFEALGGEFETFQVIEGPAIDDTASNPANKVFRELAVPLTAGVLTVTLMCSG